jgi:inositol oxygenase
MITPSDNPLRSLDEWDDDVLRRYPESSSQPGDQKDADDFRVYDDETPQHVQEFYRANHRNQTVEFNRQQRDKYLGLNQRRMSIWEAMNFLNTLVDESDPDTDLTQIQHLLQTSEAIRADGHPRWFILTGLVHDLGKILCLFGEPQWAVTGDTYPVGCAFSDSIVYPEFFLDNPDQADPRYASRCGIYEQGGGLQQVMLSWGHDEYLYHVMKEYLPAPGLAMIRYHSFYPWHHDGAYRQLMNEQDHQMLEWVKRFNPYDLYSKSDDPPDVDQLRPYYQELISEFFPETISW